MEEEGVVLVISELGGDGAGDHVVDWRQLEALNVVEDAVTSVRVDKERLLHHSHYFRSCENFSEFNRELLHVQWSSAIFCVLLACIHNFHPPLSSPMIAPLLQAAVYFGVEEVVTRCRDWVKSEMCTGRCGAEDGFVSDLLSIWSMATDNGERAIEELCVTSLAINFAEAMVRESFVTLPFALLDASVDHPELTIKSELDLCNALLLWCENQGEEYYANFLFQKIQLDLLPLDYILGRLLRKHALNTVFSTPSKWSDLVFAKSPINVQWGELKSYSNFKPVIRLTDHSKELDLSFCQLITCHHLVAAAAKLAATRLTGKRCFLMTESGMPELINMEKVNLSHCWRVEQKQLQWWLERVCPNLLELRLQHCGLPLLMVLEVGSILPNLRVLDLSEPEELADIVGAVTRTETKCTNFRNLQSAGDYFVHDKDNSEKQSVSNRLEELSLRGRSEMTDSFLQRVARSCPSLEAVDLSGCSRLSDSGIAAFLNVCNLRKLVVAGTRFGPVSCKAFVSQAGSGDELPHNLNIMDLSKCSGLGSEDLSLLLGALPSLMSLDLAFTEVDDRALSAFDGTCLERLNLRETQVSGELLCRILSRNRNVKDLNIRGCRHLSVLSNFVTSSSEWEHVEAGWGFTDANFSSFSLPCGNKLQSLVFGVGASISGQTILHISENCPQLKRLSLCFQVIHEEDLLRSIGKLTSLHTLELQYLAHTSGRLLRQTGRSLRDLKTLKLERVVPSLSDNDLLVFSQSCTNLHSLSLLGCQRLTDATLRTMTDAWRGLRDLRLEDCQHILTEDVLRCLLTSFQALEVLHLRHIGKVLPENFIEEATNKLPLLQKLGIDICDSKNGKFSRFERKQTSRLKTVYMNKCKTVRDAFHMESSSSYKRKTHKETIVLEWDVVRLKESVVEERLTFE